MVIKIFIKTATQPVSSVTAKVTRVLALVFWSLLGLFADVVVREANADKPLDAKSPTLARVFAAWKARQERVKSFHFTWDCRLSLSSGYDFPDTFVLAAVQARGEIGADNVLYTIPQSEFWGEGQDRYRDDFFMVSYSPPNTWKRGARIRNVIDGVMHSRLVVPLLSGEAPLMTVWRKVDAMNNSNQELSGDLHWIARDIDLQPLLLGFRPVNPATGMVPERCQVVGEHEVLDDAHYVKLQFDPIDDWEWQRFYQGVPPSLDRSDTCWVDPRRDYVVVRWERRRPRGNGTVSIAIDHQHDSKHGWIPSRWRQRLPERTPNARGMLEATVTRYTINEPLAGDTFKRDPPAGTRICDATVDASPPVPSDVKNADQPDRAKPSLDMILAAWKQRQAEIKTFKFVSQREWVFRGSSHDDSRGPRAPEFGDRQAFVTLKCDDTVWVDGDRFAMETAVVGGPDPLPAARRYEAAFDGQITRAYETLDNARRNGFGSVKAGFDNQITYHAMVHPVLFAFRPLVPHLGRIVPSACKVLPRGGRIDDVQCAIVETYDDVGLKRSYWVDPAREYIVLREHVVLNGQDYSRMDTSYRRDLKFGWIPNAWNFSSVGNRGTWLHSETATVTAYAINEPMHESIFQVEFPKGAQVTDGGSGQPRPKRAITR
ncbi:MAG TPA: hypothetical protein VG056_01795 [Pirellulales bacterium]|jgi:hypothetical protein|nr:hypothetical protein [Pirellulales bacterium]